MTENKQIDVKIADAKLTAASKFFCKLPVITAGYWVIKICATTLGETGADHLSMTLNLGYALSSLIFIAFFSDHAGLSADVTEIQSADLLAGFHRHQRGRYHHVRFYGSYHGSGLYGRQHYNGIVAGRHADDLVCLRKLTVRNQHKDAQR